MSTIRASAFFAQAADWAKRKIFAQNPTIVYALIKRLLFLLPAERAHHLTMKLWHAWLSVPGMRPLMRRWFGLAHPSLERELFGLKFRNPIGLAAGFDKDGKYFRDMAELGFGFIEIGTVTPRPQAGNPRPRLFRLPADRALINRMGFNNEGVDRMVERLRKGKPEGLIIGGNIGKNKDTPNERAFDDYLTCFEKLFPWVDYFVVNVSSPNTPGLRALQEREPLRQLLAGLQQRNRQKPRPKPILLKIAPDLNEAQLDDVVSIVMETGIAGIIATNTTISREGLRTPAHEVEKIGAGGLSGAPLRPRATEVIRYLHQQTGGKVPIIGVGGIASPRHVQEKLDAGASLVQVYTGLIYEGPGLVKKLLSALVR